ncbi:phage tail assembly protein [Candidatus Haliotispira prima]|uniref:Phage tail assembly protein n=1 Tax=Candidatus Haliotispira prima TaxID=3034016 RepID=A0ABY8MJR5_9SPIO|nr:phage tail assembly protein [Candidatus Haliotispira prima]
MKTFKLTGPIETGGRKYSELTLRPMKAKDMRLLMAEENAADNQINLLAALAEVPCGVIDELELADYNELCLFTREQLQAKKPVTPRR